MHDLPTDMLAAPAVSVSSGYQVAPIVREGGRRLRLRLRLQGSLRLSLRVIRASNRISAVNLLGSIQTQS